MADNRLPADEEPATRSTSRSRRSDEADHVALGARLDEVLGLPQLQALLNRYFLADASNPFAGALFDTLPDNDPARFTAHDLVAASLLDVRFGPPAVRLLLLDESINGLLAKVPVDTHFHEMATDSGLYRTTMDVYNALLEISGLGDTRASKLLARKRPILVPIGDSVITSVLGVGDNAWWRPLARALAGQRVEQLDQLARPDRVSSLRVLDVSLWMLGSNAETAQAARVEVGLDATPWHRTARTA